MLVILLGFPVRCQSKNLHFWHHLASENDVSYTLLKLSRAGLLRKVALPSRAIPYSFGTQVMLILILIDVQYSQNAVFTFGKDLNHQNHSSSGSPKSLLLRLSPPGRKIPPPQQNFWFPLPMWENLPPSPLLTAIWKCPFNFKMVTLTNSECDYLEIKCDQIDQQNKWYYTLQI